MFDRHETDTGAEVVMINEEAARRYWPDRIQSDSSCTSVLG